MDRAGDRKGSAQGRAEKLVLDLWGRTKHLCHQLFCHHSVTQNASFGGLQLFLLWPGLFLSWFLCPGPSGAVAGEPGPYSRGKVCHPLCSCSQAILIHCLFFPVQNLMSSQPLSCAVPHEEFCPGNITFFFAMSIFLRNFLDFFIAAPASTPALCGRQAALEVTCVLEADFFSHLPSAAREFIS